MHEKLVNFFKGKIDEIEVLGSVVVLHKHYLNILPELKSSAGSLTFNTDSTCLVRQHSFLLVICKKMDGNKTIVGAPFGRHGCFNFFFPISIIGIELTC